MTVEVDRPRDEFNRPLDDRGRPMTRGQYEQWKATGRMPAWHTRGVLGLLFGKARTGPDALGKAVAWAVVGGGVWWAVRRRRGA